MTRKIVLIIMCCVAFSACNSPEARRPVKRSSGTFYKESAERNKELFEKEKMQITKIINSNPELHFYSSNNGFWYFYNKRDTINQTMPKYGDRIKFTYDVKNLGGTPILSENEIGIQDYVVDKSNQDLITGLREGLKLMKEGETITFLFPSYKAYGYYGINDKLGANVPIQCTVTLKNINQTNENY